MTDSNLVTAYAGTVEDTPSYYSAKEEMYAMAELVAFDDILRTGYASQAIRNAGILANIAVDAANNFPEYAPEFRRLVDEYVDFAAFKINGGR